MTDDKLPPTLPNSFNIRVATFNGSNMPDDPELKLLYLEAANHAQKQNLKDVKFEREFGDCENFELLKQKQAEADERALCIEALKLPTAPTLPSMLPVDERALCIEALKLLEQNPADGAGNEDGKRKGRRGRMLKEESAAKRVTLLGIIREHPSLKYDYRALAVQVGEVSEATVRRWVEDEDKKYRQSNAASPPETE